MPRQLPARFDPFTLGEYEDPYPVFAGLRDAGPVCRGGPAQWLVPRYAEVAALLRDQRLGQFQFPAAYQLFAGANLRDSLGDGPASRFTQQVIVGLDRPAHTRLRSLISKAFSPALVRNLHQRISDTVDSLLAPALDRGTFDAVTDLAFPLPLTVLGELLGIPAADRAEVGRNGFELAKIFASVVVDSERLAADNAVTWLRDYFGELIADRRRSPGQDLLAQLIISEEKGELGYSEIIDNAIFVFFAGLETSMTLISAALATLPGHPEQLARLRRDDSLLPTAIEELLRYDPPTRVTGRIVIEPVEIGGRTLRKGRVVFLLIASANHDERQFPDPERLDVGRQPNLHLSFGGGIHYCLGAALARAEGAIVLERLMSRFAVIEPGGEPTVARYATLRAYASVPVQVRAV
jgi:cytochrome P450